MNTVKPSHIILERGQVLKLESGGQALTIDCADGCAWVTTSTDSNDYILCSGERLEFPAGSKIVIEGLKAQLEIEVLKCA